LFEACRYHADGYISDEPTIGTCWDADRLDLWRVHVQPDARHMNTKRGKELARRYTSLALRNKDRFTPPRFFVD
jgi:uncharacterized protein